MKYIKFNGIVNIAPCIAVILFIFFLIKGTIPLFTVLLILLYKIDLELNLKKLFKPKEK